MIFTTREQLQGVKPGYLGIGLWVYIFQNNVRFGVGTEYYMLEERERKMYVVLRLR